MTLTDIVNELADLVAARASLGRNFGLVVIPEGLVHAIPELHALITEMNAIFAGTGVLTVFWMLCTCLDPAPLLCACRGRPR